MIAIVAIFAIMIVLVFVVGMTTMSQYGGEPMEPAIETRMVKNPEDSLVSNTMPVPGSDVPEMIVNPERMIVTTTPWLGLSCDEMLDFSATDEHHMMNNDMHMEFHNYYFDQCSETELGKP